MTLKRKVNLEVKRKAAMAELTIRMKARNSAVKGLEKIEKRIGLLNEKLAKLERSE